MNDKEASELLNAEFNEASQTANLYVKVNKWRSGLIDVTMDGEFTISQIKRIAEVMEKVQ
jgi:hypothetical protein